MTLTSAIALLVHLLTCSQDVFGRFAAYNARDTKYYSIPKVNGRRWKVIGHYAIRGGTSGIRGRQRIRGWKGHLEFWVGCPDGLNGFSGGSGWFFRFLWGFSCS
jgi:hypothetical protein